MTKRPEFNLHKKPPPEKIGGFSVIVTKEGRVTVKMGKYVAFEGLTKSDACDLATLLLSSCSTSLFPQDDLSRFRQSLNRPTCACQAGGYGLGGPPDPYRRIL